jgi:hypothetical protein
VLQSAAATFSIATTVGMDLRGVVQVDPSKVPGRIPPPAALLGSVAVAARLGLGGEADHHEHGLLSDVAVVKPTLPVGSPTSS